MRCPGCGASYDDKFKFCPYCGRSKPEPTAVYVNVEEPKWEYLKIKYTSESKRLRFWSAYPEHHKCWYEAYVGPSLVARTPPYEYVTRDDLFRGIVHTPSLEEMRRLEETIKQALIDKLEAEGWEPIPNDTGEINAMRRRKG